LSLAITSPHLDAHLQKKLGATGYTVTGSTVTIPSATVSASDLQELLRVADVTAHAVTLAAGVLTLKPR
jgi:hypothetical protein